MENVGRRCWSQKQLIAPIATKRFAGTVPVDAACAGLLFVRTIHRYVKYVDVYYVRSTANPVWVVRGFSALNISRLVQFVGGLFVLAAR